MRAVLLDAAGTLMTVARPVGETYARVASRFGSTLDADALAAGFKAGFRDMPPLAFPGVAGAALEARERAWWRDLVRRVVGAAGGVERFEEYFDVLFEHYAGAAAWRLYPEVTRVLRALRARGVRLAVVSNFDSRLPPLLDGLGIAPCFDAVVCSGEVGAAKPDPAIFERALARLDVRAEEALHIGDSRRADYEGARAAGVRAALLERGGTRHSDVETAIASLDAVPDLLDG